MAGSTPLAGHRISMYKNTGDKLTILEPVVVNSVTQLGFHTVTCQ